MVRLTEGRVLIAEGFAPVQGDPYVASADDLFDPSAGTWSSAGTMSSNRAGRVAVLLQDKRALVTGAISTEPTATASVDISTE